MLLIDCVSNRLDHSLGWKLHLTVRQLIPHYWMRRDREKLLVFWSIIRDVVRFDVSYLLVRAVIQTKDLLL